MIVPFDQYQRYKHASELIDAVRESNSTYSILEVGANEHKNLERFLPNDKITYLDIVVPDKFKGDSAYIQGDATEMPLANEQFDFIISLDVFEHIPQSKRISFLDELRRVSRFGFILAAPFNTEGVSESENRANTYFKTLYGYEYPWLEEHVTNGLPDKDVVSEYFKSKDWNHYNFSHGSLEIWEKMTKLHFLAAGREALYDFRFTIDEYYNNHIYSSDYNGSCYRNFFFVTKPNKSEMIEQVARLITQREKYEIGQSRIDELNSLERDINNLSSFQLINTEINHKNNKLEEKKSELERLELKIKESSAQLELEDKNLQLQQKNGEIVGYIQLVENLTRINEDLQSQINEMAKIHGELEVDNEILNQNMLQLDICVTEQLEYIHKLEHVSQELRLKNRMKKVVPKKIRIYLKRNKAIFQALKKNPALAKKTIREIRKNGFRAANNKIHSKMTSTEATSSYKEENFNYLNVEQIKSEIAELAYKPLVSIVMPVYNVDPIWLKLAIKSVEEQIYESWELCIVDDCSTSEHTRSFLRKIDNPKIILKMLETNQGISGATNEAVSLANGEYIALLDNDDEITKDAIFEVVKAINESDADILYSDEDKIDTEGNRKYPFHKPDWSPDLLRSQMYIGHFLVFKKTLFNSIGGFRKEFDGSQDYDLMLRLSEIAKRIHHIPKVLYSWRELETSTALNPHSKPYAHHAGLKALNEHLIRVFGEGNAHADESEYLFVFDSRYNVGSNKASIIIPTKDHIELLEACVTSILEKTDYDNYEIIIINNNSIEEKTFKWFDSQRDNPKIKIVDANYDFNWSKLNNHGIREATGDVFVFLNNDTQVISKDWLLRLLEKAIRSDVGTVGGLLLYEDNTIQHAGVVIGLGGWADHIFKGMQPNHYGSPFVSPMLTRNVIASTGACLAISKNTINKIGMFNEDFIICGSDVEISLRAIQNGLYNIYDPYVVLCHLESKSRDSYIPPIDFEMSQLHYGPYLKKGDPYFNKNLDLNSLKPMLRQGD
ncbi:GT2 family glycosyltransferase/uncharacterized protein YneF (UPF0154 family) [Paenibacillus sp. DS2015]|uniref:glycosyltransferase n=1 Tax=Paenibacillus sp. DS2015 TaxID=3373917 RepID=UPI003D1CE7B2